MKHTHTSAFSIILSLGITLFLSFTGLYLLEYMVPFSRNIKDIEFASRALYQTYGGVEESLFAVWSGSIWDESTRSYSGNEDFQYTITAMGTQLPPAWQGNSIYASNGNRNIMSESQPIQLLVWKNRITSPSNQIMFRTRIPDINGDGFNETFDATSPDDDLIVWQLSSTTDSIYASGSLISEFDIDNNGLDSSNMYDMWTKNGVKLDGTQEDFWDFYDTNCRGSNECVLKISIIHPLVLSGNGTVVPYLEYRIDTSDPIPLRYAYVEIDGKSQGYSKKLKLAIPQQTTNSAFDFTVFQ